MIYETVITTVNTNGDVHIAPMGITKEKDLFIIAPFKPSTTHDNLCSTNQAVINMTDDVSIIAGCLTGRRNWPITSTEKVKGNVLQAALSHTEVEVAYVEEDNSRPRFFCKAIYSATHSAFKGFNRAQAAVLEAAILVSRLHMLPEEKITSEIAYLQIAIDKTAGEKELMAWQWLMESINEYMKAQKKEAQS
ncbi:MAG: hypothetical protein ACI9SC_002196 [Gammaproteobacteria bacterium]|jgi:hypothetical protein